MRHGAVAVLDALGFKGIYEHHAPDEILEKLTRVKKMTLGVRGSQDGFLKAIAPGRNLEVPVVDVRFFSDAIIIGASFEQEGQEVPALLLASILCASALSTAALTEPVLAYRGCLAVGDFESQDDFFVGPAIDTAAALAEAWDGAFVCVHPDSSRWVQDLNQSRKQIPGPDGQTWPFFEYDVPLKNGGHSRLWAVSPFAISFPERRDRMEQGLLRSFERGDGDTRVQSKRSNTAAMLNVARGVVPQESEQSPKDEP